MADELIITDLLGDGGDPIEYTCLDNTAIAKGAVMELEDVRTVKKVSADNKPLAGIAEHEKVANDGATTISVVTNCIAKAKCGATSATVGKSQAAHAADNTLGDADTDDDELGYSIGYALETATTGETYLVRIKK
ncbi:hypothetical protein LCGC14_2243980 [marine sediment metagenome]|uniref:Uncharacterized protein n=1 Tax=marine sediment metagenome TaxID=412755 RepID=A0A0F9FH40_9ZZZZ